MRRTKFAGILAALFILGGSTIYGATSPSIQLQNNKNNTVTIKVPNLSKEIYGIQVQLTAKNTLDKEVIFEAADKKADSFTVVKDGKLTIYITSDQLLDLGEEVVLGQLLNMSNEEFEEKADYKIVDYFLKSEDVSNVKVEYTGETVVEPENPSTPETPVEPENPSTPETPEVPNTPSTPVVPDDDDDDTGSQGNVQKPVRPNKPVEPEKPTEPEKPIIPVVEFTDTKGHWAATSIGKMAGRGVLKGYEDGSFGPSKQITRAEFAAVVARAFGFEENVTSLPFKDTAMGKWYTESVASLYKKGIITGRPDGTFGVNDSITNQEMAVMIARSLKVLSADLEAQRTYIPFADANTISPFAQEAVKELYELGIISGMPDGSYQPKASSTRAQVAVIVDRILTMMETK